jgi:hypothetical protein
VNKTEGSLLVIASIGAILTVIAAQNGNVKTDGSQRPENRGMGDDQWKEGLGLDVHLSAGIDPDDETRWHYGGGMPGESLPTNWSRHRLSYPRRQCQNIEELTVTPLNHPAFPKKDSRDYFNPPADLGL